MIIDEAGMADTVSEAAASLTVRDGKPEALKFYLDHGRVHVGDIAATTEDAFKAWYRIGRRVSTRS